MKKAFTFFIENKPQFILEANHFFIPSFEYCKLQDKNCDIVIFGPSEALDKVKDATYIHKHKYNPVSYNKEFFNYHYANSITYLSDNKSILMEYEYIFKSDADVFLCPSISDVHPDTFTTGTGYYSSQEIVEKLVEIANQKKIKYRNYFNIGATWYGKTNPVLEVAELTKQIMLELLAEYFSSDWGVWPHWYGGVCSMYASDLAINHLIDSLTITNKIDYSSAGTNPVNDTYSAHCLHTENQFSKFLFYPKDSIYRNKDISNIDISTVNNYCLYIAETSRRQA